MAGVNRVLDVFNSMGTGAANQFQLTTSLSEDTVLSRIDRQLRSRSRELCGISTPGGIELHIARDRQHLWSPALVVQLNAAKDGTRVVVHVGTHPHVWSLYIGAFAVALFTCLVGASFGYAQWTIGDSPTGFLALPAAAVILLMIALTNWAGQQLAHVQEQELRHFLETTLSDR